jgi:hypothetical protein
MKAVNKSNKRKVDPKEIQKSYRQRIEDKLEKEGVPFFEPDKNLMFSEEFLMLPQEITEVTSKELGEYLNAFTQQKMYLRTLSGRLSLKLEGARREYLMSSSNGYKELSESKMSEKAKDRILNSSGEVVQFYNNMIDCENELDLVNGAIDSIDDAIFLLSREVTRRTGDFNTENRNYNVGRR